ncbi:helix-turn-helix domain-containing protein [Lacrimispora sp.]|uniref:AraC family transcriptional regulator n=1 Tax=Lacrimispora sp. TaxID=2719234 RepID=UPI0034604E26
MEIEINDYWEPDHFRALSEDNYNISRSCEYEKNEMHHIHSASEFLFVEEGAAEYYVSGKKYLLEKGDIMVIGGQEHHQRRLLALPFLRYGLSVRPSYYESLNLGEDLKKVFSTPAPQAHEAHYKHVDEHVFNRIITLLKELYGEQDVHQPFRSMMERTVITEIAILMFRVFKLERTESELSEMNLRMRAIKDHIDGHYQENLDLKVLSELFYLHPATISREFNKYFGKNLVKYINAVRICEAAKLLENTNETVTVIAAKCGYDSVNTFLRQFKSVMETTPLQYRKSIMEWFERSKGDIQRP